MKKFKTLLLTLALGFTFAAAATAVACGGDSGSSKKPNWDDLLSDQESVVSVRFDDASLEVKQYETVVLGYTVKGTVSAVEFTSSNEEIATIDENGILTTYGELGETTITATVDGVSATSVIKVVKTEYVPEIVLNATEYTIENGETLEFSVMTEWNKAEYTGDVKYDVTFAEGYQNAQAEISVVGNEIKVVSKAVEKFDIIISTTVRGIYTNKLVTVEVKDSALKIQSNSMNFLPGVEKYVASMYATSAFGHVNSLPLEFVTVYGGEEVEADIDWSVAGMVTIQNKDGILENVPVAKVEEGKLVANATGTATLTGTATYNGDETTITVLCDVIAPEVRLNQTEELEVANLDSYTLTVTDGLEGLLQNAELHGQVVSSIVLSDEFGDSISFNKEAFPREARLLGRQQLVLNTHTTRYTMDVDIYTMIINDGAELDKMREVANLGLTELNTRYNEIKPSEYYDGYFVLGNDISYTDKNGKDGVIMSMTDTGSVWWCQGIVADFNRGFRGIFDGRGYNIDNLTVGNPPSGSTKESGGIFGYLPKSGVVKNVSFTNATLLANHGFICSMGDGTIENVSIQYKKIGGDKETEGMGDTPRTMGSFFSFQSGSNATVKNCLIDASAADITLETAVATSGKTNINIKLMGTAKNVSNVVVLCPNQTVLSNSGADINKLNYVDLMSEIEIFNKFDQSIWTTVENVPMFINQAANFDINAEVGFLNLKDSLVAGFEMLILPSNPYVKIELSVPDGVTGVVFEDSLLKASEPAFKSTVTLTVTSLFNPENTATHQVYIDSYGKEVAAPESPVELVVYNTDPTLEIGDGEWMGEENYAYIDADIISIGNGAEKLEFDLDKLVWGTQDVTIVSIKNGEREYFDIKLKKWYTAGKQEDATEMAANAFSGKMSFDGYTFTEATSELAAPEGFQKTSRIDCNKEWSTAVARDTFNVDDVSGYSDLWFAVRIVNGKFVSNATLQYNGVANWISFHYVQVSEGVWAAEVTIDGKTTVTHNVKGKQISDLLYRGGWADGFLFYNNGMGINHVETPTELYTTEILAIEK